MRLPRANMAWIVGSMRRFMSVIHSILNECGPTIFRVRGALG